MNGISGHGAADSVNLPCELHHRTSCWSCVRDQPAMPMSTVNAGVGFQILKDNPALAANVTAVRAEGLDRGYPVKYYVTGDQTVVDAWVKFLGPAAQVHPVVDSEVQWARSISTLDVLVVVSHEVEA